MRNRKRQMTEGVELPNQEKNQNGRRIENLQVYGNIGIWHHQASGYERKESKESISGERENCSKPNYIAEISSNVKNI